MNGATTWESVAVPYSTSGLWKGLPIHKLAANETPNALEYSIRTDVLPLLVTLAAKFNRRVPESEVILSLFQTPQFTSEPKSAPVIASFEQAFASIDAFILNAERNETWPYYILRPSMLSRCGWI
uniref:Uncharacterized protein n=1 Tax=Globisporangium ultimum (strain ATCC 200006 / CBS 805.95 / DAOM BR144) TaxID=431595 RepID=K3X955_GLOUD